MLICGLRGLCLFRVGVVGLNLRFWDIGWFVLVVSLNLD